jgi:hypothetical protein
MVEYPVAGNVALTAVCAAAKLVTIVGHPTDVIVPVKIPVAELYDTVHLVLR